MKNKIIFTLVLSIIAFFGLSLRLIDYDRLPPFGETMDEFLYPWQGMTLLRGEEPVGWSWLDAYKNRTLVPRWGHNHPLVSPWFEKPPLYSFVVGSLVLVSGAQDIFDVRLSLVRLVPVSLSVITIVLIGFLGKHYASSSVGLAAALLYSTNPFIIMSNRLSLTENLLTPLMLAALLCLNFIPKTKRKLYLHACGMGIIGGLAILTKQLGFIVPLMTVFVYSQKKWWKAILISVVITVCVSSIYPLLGYHYGWETFLNSQKELSTKHVQGLPQFVTSVFLYPLLGDKRQNNYFFDGTMLLGYVLLLSSPWWYKSRANDRLQENGSLLVNFPLLYLVAYSFIETGSEMNFYGWYLFPLFPFLMLILAQSFYEVWVRPSFSKLILLFLVLASSSVRFILLIFPYLPRSNWQIGLFATIFVGVLFFAIKLKKVKQIGLVLFFLLLIGVNTVTAIRLNQFYPVNIQPGQNE